MNILNGEQEKVLRIIIDNCNKNNVWEINCAREQIDSTIIDYLVEQHYIKNHIKENSYGLYRVSLTQQGANYFENKAILNRNDKKHKILEWLFWVIPNLISLGALIIAIISLNK